MKKEQLSYPIEKPKPEEMALEQLYRETAKLVRPDLTDPGRHELALELAAAKGDRDKLLELYKRLSGEPGSLVDTHA